MGSSQVCCGSISDGLAEQLRQGGSEISPGPTGSGRLRNTCQTRDLEDQHGRRIRNVGGLLSCLGAH